MKLRGKKNQTDQVLLQLDKKIKFVSRGGQLIYVDTKCLRRRDFVKPYDFKNTLQCTGTTYILKILPLNKRLDVRL